MKRLEFWLSSPLLWNEWIFNPRIVLSYCFLLSHYFYAITIVILPVSFFHYLLSVYYNVYNIYMMLTTNKYWLKIVITYRWIVRYLRYLNSRVEMEPETSWLIRSDVTPSHAAGYIRNLLKKLITKYFDS